MNANFTEAVTPTSTTPEPPVKRLRKGDVREDGRVFWQYGPNYANGEYWLSPEKFAAKKATERAEYAKKKADLSAKKAALPTKLRRGDVREDRMVFWRHDPSYVNGERWIVPEEFAVKKAKDAGKKADLDIKKATLPTKLRCGDVREDGMVFWGYHPDCTDGEHWLTPKEFAAKQAKKNARKRERRATDPLYALKDRLRCRVYSALKTKGLRKNTKTAITLGCTYEDFKAYTEARLPPDMTWETFLSDGHLDHIVPLDAADTEEDVYALNHFTNLRPMWGPDNISKSDTLPEEHELPENLHPKAREIYLTAKTACLKGYPA